MFAAPLAKSEANVEVLDDESEESYFKRKLREGIWDQIRKRKQELFDTMEYVLGARDVWISLVYMLRSEVRYFFKSERKKPSILPNPYKSKMSKIEYCSVINELMEEIGSEFLDLWVQEGDRKKEEVVRNFCPICKQGELRQPCLFDLISCSNCKLRLDCMSTLKDFTEKMKQRKVAHMKLCPYAPDSSDGDSFKPLFTIQGENRKKFVMSCQMCHTKCLSCPVI